MKNVCCALLILGLVACQSENFDSVTDEQSQNLSSSNSSEEEQAQSQTSLIQTSKAAVLIDQGGGSINLGDLATGAASLGDSNSEAKRIVMTFPLSILDGKTVTDAKLKLYFNSKSSDVIVNDLGKLSFYQIHSVSSFTTDDYSETESYLGDVIASDSTLAALINKELIEIDVTDAISDALSNGDSYFTIKLRFDNEVVNGNDLVSFYAYYTSEALDAYIPALSVTYE